MYHCVNCKKQFKALSTQDDYEFCPLCGNDQSVNEGPLPEELKNIQPAVNSKNKPFDVKAWREKREKINDFEDRRIKHYHAVYKMHGKDAATDAYKNYTE